MGYDILLIRSRLSMNTLIGEKSMVKQTVECAEMPCITIVDANNNGNNSEQPNTCC